MKGGQNIRATNSKYDLLCSWSNMGQVSVPRARSFEARKQPLCAELQHFIVHLRQPAQQQSWLCKKGRQAWQLEDVWQIMEKELAYTISGS